MKTYEILTQSLIVEVKRYIVKHCCNLRAKSVGRGRSLATVVESDVCNQNQRVRGFTRVLKNQITKGFESSSFTYEIKE